MSVRAVGFRRRLQSFPLEPRQDKAVDRVLRPAACRGLPAAPAGRGGINDQCFCHVAPCAIHRVSSSISRSVSLARAGICGGIRRRQIIGSHAADEFALGRVPGHDREVAAQVALGARFRIQPQLALALALIGPVARVAAVGENRPDIAIEFDGVGLGRAAAQPRVASRAIRQRIQSPLISLDSTPRLLHRVGEP